jgi:hypothetical protein
MVSSPALPDSAKPVMELCRLSCQRPFTLAFDLTFLQPVFSETIGFAGSFGLGFPKGKTYQSLAGLS